MSQEDRFTFLAPDSTSAASKSVRGDMIELRVGKAGISVAVTSSIESLGGGYSRETCEAVLPWSAVDGLIKWLMELQR